MMKSLVFGGFFAFLVLSSLSNDFTMSASGTIEAGTIEPNSNYEDDRHILFSIETEGTIRYTLWIDEALLIDKEGQRHKTDMPSLPVLNPQSRHIKGRLLIWLPMIERPAAALVRLSYNGRSFWIKGDIK